MNPLHHNTSATSPHLSALQQLADRELSLKARVGYVALLLAAMAMTSIVGTLWLTEPSLPLRTQMAFALMSLIGVAWTIFAVWVLKFRRVLLAYHRVVASRMAVVFSSIVLLGGLSLGYVRGGPSAYALAITGGVMLATAIVLLLRAHRTVSQLVERRKVLERQLGSSA